MGIARTWVFGAFSMSLLICAVLAPRVGRFIDRRGGRCARIAEFVLLRRAHPLVSARIATTLHPLGAAALGLAGTAAIAPFTILYGAGNGLLTIARGTVRLAVFGPAGYGERTGLLGAPARAIQSLAPFVFGLLVELLGISALFVSAGLCLSALVALAFVHPAPAQ
jgi:MFS family permease